MPRFSDALFQGLMTPVVDFSKLQEPLGMLMGGARAEREAQQSQLNLVKQAMGAKSADELSGLISKAPTLESANAALSAYGVGSKLRTEEEARLRETNIRKMIVEQAPSYGSRGKALAEQARAGGDAEKLLESFTEITADMANLPAVLNMFGVPESAWSQFEGMSPKEARAVIKDSTNLTKASVKPFLLNGEEKYLRVNNFGQVHLPGQGWVPIEDVEGLRQSPKASVVTNISNATPEQVFGRTVAQTLVENQDAAYSAQTVYRKNIESARILDSLPDEYLGLTGPLKSKLVAVGAALGLASEEELDALSTGSAYYNSRGESLLAKLKSGALGTNQSITDKDREFMESLSAMDRALTREEIKKILYLERKASWMDIENAKSKNETRLSRNKRAPELNESLSVTNELDPENKGFWSRPENVRQTYTDPNTRETIYEDLLGNKRYEDGELVVIIRGK